MLRKRGGGVAEKSRPSEKDVSFSARTPIYFISIHFCIKLQGKLGITNKLPPLPVFSPIYYNINSYDRIEVQHTGLLPAFFFVVFHRLFLHSRKNRPISG